MSKPKAKRVCGNCKVASIDIDAIGRRRRSCPLDSCRVGAAYQCLWPDYFAPIGGGKP